MPAPVTGSISTGKGGGVHVEISPPIEFILRQSGAFQRALVMQMDDMYESFRPVLGAMESDWFSSEGRGSWPALAESTVRAKGHSTILVDTGKLKASLVDPYQAMKIMGVVAEYGTDVPYAYFHQSGGWVEGRPPKREVIPDPVPAETRQALEQLQVRWIDKLASMTWGRI